jgi:hypothetical protein
LALKSFFMTGKRFVGLVTTKFCFPVLFLTRLG